MSEEDQQKLVFNSETSHFIPESESRDFLFSGNRKKFFDTNQKKGELIARFSHLEQALSSYLDVITFKARTNGGRLETENLSLLLQVLDEGMSQSIH